MPEAAFKKPYINNPDGTTTWLTQYVDPQRYPLAMPVDCAYGYAADVAKALDAPFGPAYVTVLLIYAGMESRWARTRTSGLRFTPRRWPGVALGSREAHDQPRDGQHLHRRAGFRPWRDHSV